MSSGPACDAMRTLCRCGRNPSLPYLVQNPGRLVHKNELIDKVWSNVIVTDNSIVQCVKEVREALLYCRSETRHLAGSRTSATTKFWRAVFGAARSKNGAVSCRRHPSVNPTAM